MCEGFSFVHICGHILSSKKIKCSIRICKQLDIHTTSNEIQLEAVTPIKRILPVKVSSPLVSKEVSVDCLDTTKSYLIPSLCKQCEVNGLIHDAVQADPDLWYDIVRQWSRHRKLYV